MCDGKAVNLPATHIGAQPPPGIDPVGGGFTNNSHFGFQPAVGKVLHKLRNAIKALAEEYKALSSQLPKTIEAELSIIRLEGPANPLPPAESITRELGVLNKLLLRKTAELHNKTAIANGFYGSDPINMPLQKFYKKALTMEKLVGPDGIAMRAWQKSYRAAHDARLLSQTIQLLNQQSANMQNRLRAVQAEDRARLAVEREAKRLAAEKVRVAAEAEAKRLAAEKARVAAEAEAKRLAAEKARVAAEAEAKRLAAEQARIAAEAETQRVAAEQAGIAAEQEAKRQAEEHARQEAIKAANTFPAAGAAAASVPVFAVTAASVATSLETSVALQVALRGAVAAVIGTAAAPVVLAGTVVAVVALVLIRAGSGNSDQRYSMSVPLSELAPEHGQDLQAIAAAGGEVDLPARIGSKAAGEGSEVFVTATDGVKVPSKVRVRFAAFDAQANLYTVATSDSPPRILTWTPSVTPGNSSTALPTAQPDIPIYAGASVTPVVGRVDTFPSVADETFDDYVIVFPLDSGMPPVYVMYKDRREEPGVASGNGQSVSGLWLGASTQGEGAPIPSQIADQLRGKEFKTFGEFRKAFWRAVGADAVLREQLKGSNKLLVQGGAAPFPIPSEQVGGRNRFEIHHVKPLNENGALYDIDNLRILTPRRHIEIHSKIGSN